MSASDLPEMRDGGPLAMAKLLVTYMEDPLAIRSAIKSEFDFKVPDVRTIRSLRAQHLKRQLQPEEAPFKAHEGYYPADIAERAQEASKRFVAALDRERHHSFLLARSMGALDSPALRQQAIVDRAWDREAEKAWLANGELR